MTVDDVDRLVTLNDDEEVMRYLSRTPPGRAQVERDVREALDGYDERYELGRYVADDVAAEFVGWFGVRPSEAGWSEPELGYRLRRSVWGRGLATEGCRAVIDHAFRCPDVQRVWAETMAVNVSSRRVMDKCGLTHVDTFRRHFDDPLPGTELGEVRYELTRAAWVAAWT